MSNNIKSMPNKEADEQRAALESLKRNLPVILELASVTAQIRRANYLAYIYAGFSEAQALELAKGSLV